MKLPKKLHIALILMLLASLLYHAFQIEWSQLFQDTFEWKSIKGFSISLLVMLVLFFQFRNAHQN